jgi:hypothetical protein
MAALGLTDYAADPWRLVQCLDRLTSDGPGPGRRAPAGRGLVRGDVVGPLERLCS